MPRLRVPVPRQELEQARIAGRSSCTIMILHAEDDANDAMLVKVAFSRAGYPVRIHNVSTGEQVIDYLAGTGRYSERGQWPLPKLILLDLKMPAMGGFEVLSWAREQPPLRSIPIVVLTSSHLDADSKLARKLGATAYIEKSPDFQDVVALVRTLLAAAERVESPTPALAFDQLTVTDSSPLASG